MTRNDPIAVVQAFHDQLNDKDVPGVLELATDDIRIGGPRGSGEGKYLLEEWVGRANISMTPKRWFRSGDTVVVEQFATWRDPHSGAETGSQTVASVFTVTEGRISAIARYGFLAEAVNSADMDESNEIEPPIQ
jgi:ketosteroid isomerase-like protein